MAAQPRPPVLLTRPAAQSARFAAALQGRGTWRVEISPIMAPVFLRPDLPSGGHDAVIFTSETGVRAAQAGGWVLPVRAYCVGDRTAEAARAAGFDARSARGDAAALVEWLATDPPAGRLIHLRGAEARGDVAAVLTARGLPCDEAVIYDQRPQPLTARARALLDRPEPVILPLFSPRSAALVAGAAAGSAAPLWIAAFSPAVAQAACGIAARLTVAPRPDVPGMLIAIESLTVI